MEFSPAEAGRVSRKLYKPWILRNSTLGFLLVVILGLTGMSEYSFHAMPVTSSDGLIDPLVTALPILKRGESTSTSTITRTYHRSVETVLIIMYQSQFECPVSSSCTPPPAAWLPVGTITIGGKGGPFSPTTTTPRTTPTPTPAEGAWLHGSDRVYVFTNADYFLGAFLPTILSVLFALPWAIIDARARDLEPWQQLSRPGGTSANHTVCMNYTSPFAIFAPLKALVAGHWTPLMTSMLSWCAIAITPFAPEFVSIKLDGECSATQENQCIPSLGVNPIAGRIIEGILCIMALLTVLLLLHLRRYNSGVYSDPTSIASLAALFGHQSIKAIMLYASVSSSQKQMSKAIAKQKYKLEQYTENDGTPNYGLVNVNQPASSKPQHINPNAHQNYISASHQPVGLRYAHWKGAVGLFCLLLCLLGVTLYYWFNGADSGFERFMDSNGFGVRFLFTLIGVIIKLYWSSIFLDISSTEAYHQLAKGSTTAQKSILMPKYSDPITALPVAMLHGQMFLAIVAASAFLAEVLTICLSNTHFSPNTTLSAFTVSVWLSCAIMGVMFITLIAVILRQEPELPFKPDTIAAVLCYLCAGSVPGKLKGMALLDGKTRDQNVKDLDLRYGLVRVNDTIHGSRVIIEVES